MFGLFTARPRFTFHDAGPLVDGDLELVAPQQRYVDDLLTSSRDPRTLALAPEAARVTREGLRHFLDTAPMGHHPGESRGSVPSYHFWMKLTGGPLKIAGGIGLRIGDTPDVRNFIGHLGYNVYPAVRGRHLAERSCRLLLPLARRHGLKTLWITCNPDNIASRRTCERLGETLVDVVTVPDDHELFARGDRQKCRFRIDL